MNWIDAVRRLRRTREAAVLVTLVGVRGHAPRRAGAKMVVTADESWGTIGGGNLEATAQLRARQLLAEGLSAGPQLIELELSDHAEHEFGKQCCGGQTSVLLEPLPVVPVVAIFGMGHVGRELARILSRHDLDLVLGDSRAAYASPDELPALGDALAHVRWQHAPWPEPILTQLPAGAHVLVMTHDHAEDAAICDAALRHPGLAFIGLIGSRGKRSRIDKALREWGHSPAETARITCPIGDPSITGKEPATIALSVAADLVRRIADEMPTVAPPLARATRISSAHPTTSET